MNAKAAEKPEPFTIAVQDGVLEDLRRRLAATKWPDDFNNEDERYGIAKSYMRQVVDYWLTAYDWRAVERQINSFAHYRAKIEDIPIHFIREPGRGPKPIPLILTHGWPWTFWDMHKVVRELADPGSHGGDPADAFEVIVPSLPGFGFSTPLPAVPMNFWMTANLWNRLMTESLGFERFAAAGGDWGAIVTKQLGHKYAANLYGIHTIHPSVPLSVFNNDRSWDMTEGLIPANTPPEVRKAIMDVFVSHVSHVAIHVLDSQTIAYALHDSPAGLLAWLARRRRDWSDPGVDWDSPAEMEHLITTTMIYWVTNSFVTSARYYADASFHRWQADHDRRPTIEAPTGITLFGGHGQPFTSDPERFRSLGHAADFNLHYLNGHASGGHFGHYENPAACIGDIRATFRTLRN